MDKRYISYEEVEDIIEKQVLNKMNKPNLIQRIASKLIPKASYPGIWLADGLYYTAPLNTYKKIIRDSIIDSWEWREEAFDCDDFAMVLKGQFAMASYKNGLRRAPYCFGIVWGNLPSPHAINWFIDSTHTFWFIEPQSDQVFQLNDTIKDIWIMIS